MRRAKAIIPASSQTLPGGIRSIQQLQDVKLLTEVILHLSQIYEAGKGEVFELLNDRCLVDLLAGYGELAFNPSRQDELTVDVRTSWKQHWETLIEGCV